MITDISQPTADIEGDAALPSTWAAVHEPTKWQLKREDQAAMQMGYLITPGVSPAAIQISGLTGEPIVGDYIYIENGDESATGAYLITGVSEVAGNTIVVIDLALPSIIAGGFVNYIGGRTNYFVEVVSQEYIYGADNVDLGAMRITPTVEGFINVNPMEYLKTLVDYNETFLHNETLFLDDTLGRRYTIKWREVYGTTTTAYTDATLNATLGSYITNSSKQLQDEYGSNMAAYVPNNVYATSKFMTDYETPTYYEGYPFSLTFILSRDLTHQETTTLIKSEGYYDINNALISGVSIDIFDVANEAGVARLMVEDTIPAGTKTIRVWLESTDGGLHSLTETKIINYESDCSPETPVYLNWLGTNGGRNYCLVEGPQTEVLDVRSTGEFEAQAVDLATDVGQANFTGKAATPSLVCYGYLKVSDLRGVEGLLKSPDVLMLMNPDTWTADNLETSPVSEKPIWKRVKLVPETYKIMDTNQTHAEIEFTLDLPKIHIQQQ